MIRDFSAELSPERGLLDSLGDYIYWGYIGVNMMSDALSSVSFALYQRSVAGQRHVLPIIHNPY
jgi:hypothetical protein